MVTQDEIDCRLDDAEIIGLERGMVEKAHEMVKSLRDQGISISVIATDSGLSESKIKSL